MSPMSLSRLSLCLPRHALGVSQRGVQEDRFPRKSFWSYKFRSHGKGVVGPSSLAGGKRKGKHFRRGGKWTRSWTQGLPR
eukprot:6982147-Karenia_brevis.AAC.1